MTDIDRARSALNHFLAGCPRDEWVRIGMAAKSAGLSFEDFHSWSKDADNYENEKSCRDAWNSFKDSGAITAATLFYLAKEKGWKDTLKIHTNSTNGNNRKKNSSENNKTSQQSHNDEAENSYAFKVWKNCEPASPTHEYILRKQGNPDGLRVYPTDAPALIIKNQNIAGHLVLPCFSNSQLQTLQFIPPNGGEKLNFPGETFNDGFFVAGKITDNPKLIYLCEGIGQAWAINKSSCNPAVVCFGIVRIKRVAKVLRDKYPKTRLVIAPDRGQEIKAAEIAAAVGGQWIELPPDKEANYDANDYALEFGYSELARLMENVKSPLMRYKLLSSGDLLDAPPMHWLIQGIIPAEGLAALYGASGSGKSFLVLDMACAIAAGVALWFNHRVTQAPVIYVCLEGEAGLSKRIKAWSLHHKKIIPDALRFIINQLNLLSDDVFELAKSIIAMGGAGGLVIIDTLNRAAPGVDENSSKDMGNLIAAANKLQNLIGGLVLLVHHSGKNEAKGLRGHSSLHAALDSAIEVVKTTNRREWNVAKSKDDITGENYSFTLKIISTGVDINGEEITSCVAVPENCQGTSQKKKPPLRGSNQIIALNILTPHFKSSMNYSEVAPDKPAIQYDDAIRYVAERMPVDKGHQKNSAQVAISGLVKNGYLGFKSDWLWLE